MDKTSSVIDFNSITYSKVKYYIEQKNQIDSSDTINYNFYEKVFSALEEDLNYKFLGYKFVDNNHEVNINTGKIYINPKIVEQECKDNEFVYKTCRYASNNCTEVPPNNSQYTNIYHLYQIIKYVYLQKEVLMSKNDNIVGNYFEKMLSTIDIKNFTNSKKYSKLSNEEREYLSYLRYANLNAARFICELFKVDKINSLNGCFGLLGYILYSNALVSGYTKTDFIGRKIETNPVQETLKILGINDSMYSNPDISIYDKVTYGFSVETDILEIIKRNSLSNYQSNLKSHYDEMEKVLKLR